MDINQAAKGSIVVFGGGGQVGSELGSLKKTRLITLKSSECNITEYSQIVSVLDRIKPQLVINCAAFTAVDRAETESHLAYLVNSKGPELLAQACIARDIGFIHLSTDYVFAGDGHKRLTEESPTNPLSVYGASKLQGEEAVRAIMGSLGITVRTSAVFGQNGPNFVLTMLKLFSSRPTIDVVNDQWMSPTWTGWLAPTLLEIGDYFAKNHTFPVDTLHACYSGQTNWFNFSQYILKQSGCILGEQKNHESDVAHGTSLQCNIRPISAAQFNAAAKRPLFSVLDTALLQEHFGITPLPWQEGLNSYLSYLGYCKGEAREYNHTIRNEIR